MGKRVGFVAVATVFAFVYAFSDKLKAVAKDRFPGFKLPSLWSSKEVTKPVKSEIRGYNAEASEKHFENAVKEYIEQGELVGEIVATKSFVLPKDLSDRVNSLPSAKPKLTGHISSVLSEVGISLKAYESCYDMSKGEWHFKLH